MTRTPGPRRTTKATSTNNGNGTKIDSRTVTDPNGKTDSNSYTRY
jgi:hypothetical protein